MGDLTKEDILKIRDITNEMEPNLHFKENIDLWCKRVSAIMEEVIFNRNEEISIKCRKK